MAPERIADSFASYVVPAMPAEHLEVRWSRVYQRVQIDRCSPDRGIGIRRIVLCFAVHNNISRVVSPLSASPNPDHLLRFITTPPARERKHMGAILVGLYEDGRLKFAGRVGIGFSEKLLNTLSFALNKIAVKACPFFPLPAADRGLDSSLTVAEMKRCVSVTPLIVCEVEWTRDDRIRPPVFPGLREDKNPPDVVRE
jgi:hypothetical protein